MTTTQQRTPAGSPDGGEFAAIVGAETDLQLTLTEPATRKVGATRSLPTGSWCQVAPDQWRKLCGKCGGTGEVHSSVDYARCWGCEIGPKGNRTGFAPGVKTRTTAELDRKEAADTRRAVRDQEARQAAADAYLAAHADQRAAEAAEEAAAEETKATKAAARRDACEASRHLAAAVGDKVTVAGKAITATTIECASYSGYGVDSKRLVVLEMPDGVQVKMFTAAGWAWGVDQGMDVTVAATVKKHDEYDGFKQTQVTRPKLMCDLPERVNK